MTQELRNTYLDKIYDICHEIGTDLDEVAQREIDTYDIDQFTPVCSGVSKICFLDKSFGKYVVKVPFLVDEDYEELGYYDEDTDEFESRNYCEDEVNFYKAATERGLGILFAKTEKLGVVHGIDTYVQERVEKPSHYAVFTNDNMDLQRYCEEKDVYTGASFIIAVDKFYGEAMAMELIDFLADYDINDIHSENWGFTVEGRPKCYDFSGYHG